MAATDAALVVLDAGPLIHLDELGCLQLLEGFTSLLIPTIVWGEAVRHRPQLQLSKLPSARIADPHGLLLSDDDAARQTAEALGFSVAGTLGLLLRGIRRKQITSAAVRQLIATLPERSTLHVSRSLLKRFSEAIPG